MRFYNHYRGLTKEQLVLRNGFRTLGPGFMTGVFLNQEDSKQPRKKEEKEDKPIHKT